VSRRKEEWEKKSERKRKKEERSFAIGTV